MNHLLTEMNDYIALLITIIILYYLKHPDCDELELILDKLGIEFSGKQETIQMLH